MIDQTEKADGINPKFKILQMGVDFITRGPWWLICYFLLRKGIAKDYVRALDSKGCRRLEFVLKSDAEEPSVTFEENSSVGAKLAGQMGRISNLLLGVGGVIVGP